MSKMSELAMEIEELYVQGYSEFTIATMLNIPVELVDNFVASFIDVDGYYLPSMDGDFDSAMASAGYGTDEDYGSYGEPEF